ncbi:MAG: hypothetical protein AAFY41_17985, partial [Bacteroidota bacterium]
MQLRVSTAQLVLIVSSGFFLGFVLLVYKAFGIYQGVSFSGHSLIVRVILFGLSVILTFAINELVLRPYINLISYVHVCLWLLWEVFSAASITHLLFNYFWNW